MGSKSVNRPHRLIKNLTVAKACLIRTEGAGTSWVRLEPSCSVAATGFPCEAHRPPPPGYPAEGRTDAPRIHRDCSPAATSGGSRACAAVRRCAAWFPRAGGRRGAAAPPAGSWRDAGSCGPSQPRSAACQARAPLDRPAQPASQPWIDPSLAPPSGADRQADQPARVDRSGTPGTSPAPAQQFPHPGSA